MTNKAIIYGHKRRTFDVKEDNLFPLYREFMPKSDG